MSYKTIVEEDIDILVCGAGLGGTGAAFEARLLGSGQEDRYRRKSQHRPLWRCGAGPVRHQLLHGHPLRREQSGRPRALRPHRLDGHGA